MSVIKEISVFNGSTWESSSIGANASNITLSNNIAGSTNLNTALSNILPASQLSSNAVVVTDGNKKLTAASNVSSTKLNFLTKVSEDGNSLAANILMSKNSACYFEMKNTSVDSQIGALVPSSNVYYGAFQILDKNDYPALYVRAFHNTEDRLQGGFITRRKSADGNTQYLNGFYANITNNGEYSITFPNTLSQKAWFEGILPMSTASATLTAVTNPGTAKITLIKLGRICYARVNAVSSTVGSDVTIGTVPSGFRPLQPMYCPISYPTDGQTVVFYHDGTIKLNKKPTASMYGACMYIIE